ncbi:ArsA-related P-loop ATPase [Paraconexibacter sp. AEG42_29]
MRLLDKSLILVTGKGGVGKSTVAAALGRAAVAAGHRTMVCEVSSQARMATLLGGADAGTGAVGEERELEPGLWTVTIDPDDALKAWLANQLGSRPLVNILTRSNLFSYFVAAAPGARELVTMTRVWEMAQVKRWDKRSQRYDVVIADLPASGHALGMMRAPKTFLDIARIGPIASQAGQVTKSLADPGQAAIVAVTLPGELPVSETLELEGRTVAALGRGLDLIVANDVFTKRWTAADAGALADGGAVEGRIAGAAAREAARTAVQQRQLRRLRDGATVPVLALGHLTAPSLGPPQITELSEQLAGKLAKL